MPELPEVEVVRRGLERHVVGRTVLGVEVYHTRPLRQQDGGPSAFGRELTGRVVTAAVRRGKRMWLPLDDGRALSAHLGMSGQLLVRGTAPSGHRQDLSDDDPARPGARDAGRSVAAVDADGLPPADLTATSAPTLVRDLSVHPRHLRVRLHLSTRSGDPVAPGATAPCCALDLVDQRMLGGMHLCELVPTADGAPGGWGSHAPLVPADAGRLARDLLDPHLDRREVVRAMRRSRRAVKTLLLDQSVVSGIGSIYADEGLWAARVHGAAPGTGLGPRVAARLLEATAQVMRRALEVGGTSFDALYVDAEGAAGYFARQLAAYGRGGRPCGRCGRELSSQVVGGRSHVFCPRCQRRR